MRSFEPAHTLLTDRVDKELLGAAWPQLKVVANYAVGFDNIDLQACTERGCWPATRLGVLTETAADTALDRKSTRLNSSH